MNKEVRSKQFLKIKNVENLEHDGEIEGIYIKNIIYIFDQGSKIVRIVIYEVYINLSHSGFQQLSASF